MAETNTVRARLLVDLRPLLPKDAEVLALDVSVGERVTCLSHQSRESRRRHLPGGGTTGKSRFSTPSDLQILEWHSECIRRAAISCESVVVNFVQACDDGYLLAGSRCRETGGQPEKNALIVDGDGRVQNRLTLGDGIQDLAVTQNGQIWVSYFDEGVMGEQSWYQPVRSGFPFPGILCFDTEGAVTFAYNAAHARTDIIVDAYAMNVAGADDIWTCFYSEFPIVRVHRGRYQVWRNETRGVSAMAVDGRRVLLVGNEGPNRDQAHVLELGSGGSSSIESRVSITAEDGSSLARARFVGQGPMLYALTDTAVYSLDRW